MQEKLMRKCKRKKYDGGKCKVIDLLKLAGNTVAVLDFLEPTYFKVGDKLKSSNGLIWTISRITKGTPIDLTEESLINSIYQWDCTIDPVGHAEQPIVGEELSLFKE
jgi:hypothetical protein